MKKILVGVTGSIAAYKAIDLVSQLSKNKDYDVEVLMTAGAMEFVQPLSFESLLHKKVYTSPFISRDGEVVHVSLAKDADLFIMVPATANSIAKAVHGIADNIVMDTWLAATCHKMICPAMNTHMFQNEITQNNLKLAKQYGIEIIEPVSGHLACGDIGQGKLAGVDEILERMEIALSDKPLLGKKVLISAGPTQEAIDPVRYITNHSSGKQGYALARQAKKLGATVTLVSGQTSLKTPYIDEFVSIKSSKEMADAILSRSEASDYIIMSAAIADYRPATIATQKIKKKADDFKIELERTQDILLTLGQTRRDNQMICGFAMETENLLENASIKLTKKNCDMIVANSIATKGAGFQTDTNIATLITKDGLEPLDIQSKDDLAKTILLRLKEMEDKKSC